MVGRDFRSVFPDLFSLCRDFFGMARRGTGTGHSPCLCGGCDSLGEHRHFAHARRVPSSAHSAVARRYHHAGGSFTRRNPSEPLVDHLDGGLPACDGARPRRPADRPGHDPGGLCLPGQAMVVADGGPARAWHVGASAAAATGDYRAGLEAFLRSAGVTDAIGAAATLSARFATLSELLSADGAVVAGYAGEQVAAAIASARALMILAAAERLRERRPIRSEREAAPFLKTLIGFRSDEALAVIFLDFPTPPDRL